MCCWLGTYVKTLDLCLINSDLWVPIAKTEYDTLYIDDNYDFIILSAYWC